MDNKDIEWIMNYENMNKEKIQKVIIINIVDSSNYHKSRQSNITI